MSIPDTTERAAGEVPAAEDDGESEAARQEEVAAVPSGVLAES